MQSPRLHVVSFTIPYPPNYGGVIDVYYKLKSLAELGVDIDLHCFQYGNRHQSDALEEICHAVYYYPRQAMIPHLSGPTPYIVSSRRDKVLGERLSKHHFPILFEGLHSCFFIDQPRLKNHLKFVRLHNIEWQYYRNLSILESNIFKKYFFKRESGKLRYYEHRVFEAADLMLCISSEDCRYIKARFGIEGIFIPPFHAFKDIAVKSGSGDFILFHGDLGVSENALSAIRLASQVFSKISFPVIIAGKNPPKKLRKVVAAFPNIHIRENVSDSEMRKLFHQAHIHVLHGLHDSGFKIKLLHALFSGRHCVANKVVIEGTGLESCITEYHNLEELKQQLERLINIPFTNSDLKTRKSALIPTYSNYSNARRIVQILQDKDMDFTKTKQVQ